MPSTVNRRLFASALSGLPFGVLYGLAARLAFDGNSPLSDLFATMTIGFLCLVPFAVGALTVYLAPEPYRTSTKFALLMPILSTAIWVGVATLLGMEAAICVLMASPLLAAMASFGGLVVAKALEARQDSTPTMMLLLFLAAPFLLTPLELQQPAPDSFRSVHNSIDIAASEEAVWRTIVSVPTITEAEQGWSLFHLLGLPRPLAAVVTHEGVGGVRSATFERGLTFVETVTLWEPNEQLGFQIEVDKSVIRPAPLNNIGSQYLDVMYGEYRLEPLPDGRIRLHLSSEHRLSTRFNWYGGVWSDLIMRDLQGYILEILKARAEGI